MQIQIRPVITEDNRALAGMIRKVFDEHDAPRQGTVYSDPTTNDLFTLFQAPRSILWVAVVDSEAAGCCGIYPTEGLPARCAELVKFYLDQKYRGAGLGKELMLKSISSAKELGYSKIYLESLPQFAKALSMYEALGFERITKPLGQSGHSGCNIWMVKDI